MALLLALLFEAAIHQADPPSVEGFTRDGRFVALQKEEATGVGEDTSVSIVSLSRGTEVERFDRSVQAMGVCAESGPRACEAQEQRLAKENARLVRWVKAHPMEAEARSLPPVEGLVWTLLGERCKPMPVKAPLSMDQPQTVVGARSCGPLWFSVSRGSHARAPVSLTWFEYGVEGNDLTAAAQWSPDGQYALLINPEHTQKKVVAAEAKLELLGSASARSALVAPLAAEGYVPSKQGAPKGKHATTELYFAPLFEAEAKRLGTVLGLAATDVKPLSWDSPFALTLVAADARH